MALLAALDYCLAPRGSELLFVGYKVAQEILANCWGCELAVVVVVTHEEISVYYFLGVSIINKQ